VDLNSEDAKITRKHQHGVQQHISPKIYKQNPQPQIQGPNLGGPVKKTQRKGRLANRTKLRTQETKKKKEKEM